MQQCFYQNVRFVWNMIYDYPTKSFLDWRSIPERFRWRQTRSKMAFEKDGKNRMMNCLSFLHVMLDFGPQSFGRIKTGVSQIPPPGPSTSSSWGNERERLSGSHRSAVWCTWSLYRIWWVSQTPKEKDPYVRLDLHLSPEHCIPYHLTYFHQSDKYSHYKMCIF